MGKRKGDLRRDEEGEDGDLVGDHDSRWWLQGRKILLLEVMEKRERGRNGEEGRRMRELGKKDRK